MTLKHQINHHYFNLLSSLKTITLPEWVSSAGTRVVLSATVVLMGLLYLTQTGSTAVAGYQINDLDNQVSQLSDEIEKIESDIAEQSSLATVKERVSNLNLVAVSSVKYLTPASAVVARR